MTAYLLTDHLLNFFAPAAFATLIFMLLARVFSRFLKPKAAVSKTIYAQAAIIFIVNASILTAGLVLFKNDGKMPTYAAMVFGSALCQWLLWRGWVK